MEKDFNSMMQKYKEELMRFDAMQKAAGRSGQSEQQMTQQPSQTVPSQGSTNDTNQRMINNERESKYETVFMGDEISTTFEQENMDLYSEQLQYQDDLYYRTPTGIGQQDMGCLQQDRCELNRPSLDFLAQMEAMDFTQPSVQAQNQMSPLTQLPVPNQTQPQDEVNLPSQMQENDMQRSMKTETGELVVHVTEINRGTPIQNASVIVARDFESGTDLFSHSLTDVTGNTKVFVLPAPAVELSQLTMNAQPYSTYDIRISAPGFYLLTNLKAQIIAGQRSLIEANMVPLPQSGMNSRQNISINTPPSNLFGE